jgi:hypothetical protein
MNCIWKPERRNDREQTEGTSPHKKLKDKSELNESGREQKYVIVYFNLHCSDVEK